MNRTVGCFFGWLYTCVVLSLILIIDPCHAEQIIYHTPPQLLSCKLASLSPRFFKKASGYCNRLRPAGRPSVTLSPPKQLDEIQPNLVCE